MQSYYTCTIAGCFVIANMLRYTLLLSLFLECLLDGLYLLGDSREHSFLQTVELIKASPGTDLAQTNEDTTHGLEVKCLITVEDQHKAT